MPEKGLVLAAAATAEDWKACIGIGSLLHLHHFVQKINGLIDARRSRHFLQQIVP